MNYEKKCKKALKRARNMLFYKEVRQEDMEYIFPELKESKNERIKKALIEFFKSYKGQGTCASEMFNEISTDSILAWLEQQGKKTSWKPSKDEMDALYGLAYITNTYDENKEEVIIRLYQDLKREFFNGSSYENMFPTNAEDGVKCRSFGICKKS